MLIHVMKIRFPCSTVVVLYIYIYIYIYLCIQHDDVIMFVLFFVVLRSTIDDRAVVQIVTSVFSVCPREGGRVISGFNI